MAITLFRGLKDGKMLYSTDCYDLSMFFSLVDPNTVMICTSRADINGTPIYECDYVYEFMKSKGTFGKFMRVDWDAKQMGFILRYYLENKPNPPMATFDYPARYKSLKVVGNIYENPHLQETLELKEQGDKK
jgi:hypothetical protein